jgi:hypothetical protein
VPRLTPFDGHFSSHDAPFRTLPVPTWNGHQFYTLVKILVHSIPCSGILNFTHYESTAYKLASVNCLSVCPSVTHLGHFHTQYGVK